MIKHPKVADVAVIGSPDAEMCERVVAAIQPLDPDGAGDDLAEQLLLFCRAHLSGSNIPPAFDFRQELPRTPTGKLMQRHLRDEYWAASHP